MPNLGDIYEFTKEYLKFVERNSGNPILCDFIETKMTFKKSLSVFCTNSEISIKSFMQSGDLISWYHALSQEDQWGEGVLLVSWRLF